MRRLNLFGLATLFLISGLSIPLRPYAQSAGGTIAGTLRYTDGSPVAGLRVVIATITETTSSQYSASMSSDSMGHYRGTNIPPGRYDVKVGGICQNGGVPCPSNAPIYLYYPGTVSQEAAALISVAAGVIRENIDFTLTPAKVTELKQAAAKLGEQAQELWELRRTSVPTETASWSSIDEMHKYYVASFIATPGMGSGRMGEMMLQFDPRKPLLLSTGLKGKATMDVWTLRTLDLIGIAKHDQPAVFSRVAHGTYALDSRKLTEFEQRALSELRTGKEIVRNNTAGSLSLVGAIRAKASCLSCHDGYTEGDLLGAFRYDLQPSPAALSTPSRTP